MHASTRSMDGEDSASEISSAAVPLMNVRAAAAAATRQISFETSESENVSITMRPGSSSGALTGPDGEVVADERVDDMVADLKLSDVATSNLQWLHRHIGPQFLPEGYLGSGATGDVVRFISKFRTGDDAALESIPEMKMSCGFVDFEYSTKVLGGSLFLTVADIPPFAAGNGLGRGSHMERRQALTVDVNPRLDPEENTGLGNPPCFCPFIMNLSPLAQTLPFVHMCIEPRKNSDAIEFPNTRVAIPVVHERLFTHLDPVYEGASLVVKHVGLVRQFVEPVTASAAIRTLVLREVLVLDDISIERMPHLRVLDIAPVAAPAPRPATVAVHFETLPALRDFALDMARGVLTKEYGLPPFRMGNARAPTPHWAPLRLSMLRITGTERAQLKVFELAVNGEDLDDLVRTPHDESAAESASDPYHPLLRFKRVKRFQLYVQLREHGDALYRRRSGDYNLSPYNPFPVHQAVMRRAHEAFESFAAGDLESMRYKASSVLPLMAADRFLAAVQGMDVRIFSMNAQAAVALRWAKFNGVFVSSVDPQTGRSVAVADDAAEARPPNVDVPVVVIEVTPMIRRDSLLARAGDRCLYQSISRKQRSEMRKAGPRKEKRYVVQCATPRWPVLSLGVEDCLPPMVDAATMVYPWQTEEYEPWYYFAVSQDACVLMLPGCVENVKDKQRYVMSKQLQRTEKLYPPAMLRLTHTHTDLCSVAMLPLRGLIGGR